MGSHPPERNRISFDVRQRAQRTHARRFSSHLLLRKNRFRYAEKRTMLGTAYLFGDRIELRHWSWWGRKVRRIPLTQILEVNYHPLDERGNLTLYLEPNETLYLTLDEAHRWREHFEQWLSYAVLPSAKMTGADGEQAASLSG